MKYLLLVLNCVLFIFVGKGQVPCSLDNTFDQDGKLTSDGSRIADRICALPDDKSIIAYNPMSTGHVYVKKINADGSTDNTFGNNGKLNLQVASNRTEIKDMLFYNNKMYCCGTTSTGTNTYPFIARFHLTGKLDTTYAYGGYNYNPQHYSYTSLAIESSTGKLIVGGMKDFDEIVVTRVHTDGYFDGNFGTIGETTFKLLTTGEYYEVRHLNIDNSGKIILTGKYYVTQGTTFSKIFVARLQNTGAKDNTFTTGAIAYYNSGSNNYDEGRKIYANSNNDYYIIGATWKYNADYDYTLLKIKNNSSPDPSFDNDGWKLYNLGGTSPEEYLLNGAMMNNGNLLLTGNQGSGDTVYFSMLMVKPDGTPDNNFAPNGIYKHIFGANNNNSSAALALSEDGKIYLGGYTRTCANGVCGPLYAGIARYLGGQQSSTAVSAINPLSNLSIYPTLIKAEQTIHCEWDSHEPISISAFSITGQAVEVENNGRMFKIKQSTTGIYFVKIKSNSGFSKTFRVQVQ